MDKLQKLDTQREIVKKKTRRANVQEEDLKALYDQKARKLCPYNIGD